MKLRPFELALVIIFVLFAFVALFVLKIIDPPSNSSSSELVTIGTVSIWGTLPGNGINQILSELAEENEAYNNVTYRYFRPSDFDSALLSALADGVGPDLILVSQEKLVEMRRRIQPVSIPKVDFGNLYLDGASVFYMSDGVYGLPIAVDPLMMYWNKDILTNKGYLNPPQTWENLVNIMFPELISRDFDRTINRSVVAMGEYSNIRNAFGIISALMIQGGSELVAEDKDGNYVIKLQSAPGGSDPLFSAADFYTKFSKPSNTLYSWNRSLAEDRFLFTSEDLVFYFGYGSEGREIENSNPNLNFAIAEIPQGATATVRRTYGKFYALSLLKSSDNFTGAGNLMNLLGGENIATRIAIASNMAPAHRSTVNLGSDDDFDGNL